MGIAIKRIELENFKSYRERQSIKFSNLSVLLGANSSGKSTALQALLVLKQTMESNSPDEELLLSGKYVALGDFDDVISDKSKDYFCFAIVLEQTEKNENSNENDIFSIEWKFKRGMDETSAILSNLNIVYENLHLSFEQDKSGLYYMFESGKRSKFSVIMKNLMVTDYVLHYDVDLNANAVDFINSISKILISKKTANISANTPICAGEIENFYFRIMDKIDDDSLGNNYSDEYANVANRIYNILKEYGSYQLSQFKTIMRIFPSEYLLKMLQVRIENIKEIDTLKKIVEKHESFLKNYEEKQKCIEDYQGVYRTSRNSFVLFDGDDEKEGNLTQLKYTLDFYKEFYYEIIKKMFFVGPIRENPKGLYNIGFETVPKYVGPTGSYFASVLLHENKKEREYILPNRVEVCTLSEALAEWMIHLNVASSVNVDKKNSFGFSVSIENMEQIKSDIMNVGIGTSQVLPVLISVLLSEKNEILLFEQPELHLHPYSQSKLADMFCKFCKHGRKIVLETHSEYFLLRLRYQIVKQYYGENEAAVNFFENNGGTKVTCANISGYGNIEYPEDFRDETQALLDSILEAALERKGLV